jgi:C4-type Zn-finger protein
MNLLSNNLKCPSCGGSRLVAGTSVESWSFAPKGKVMLFGYAPIWFVCRDCGYLGRCLSEKDRAELDGKVGEPQPPKD